MDEQARAKSAAVWLTLTISSNLGAERDFRTRKRRAPALGSGRSDATWYVPTTALRGSALWRRRPAIIGE